MQRKTQNRSLQLESLEDRKLMTAVTELGGTAIIEWPAGGNDAVDHNSSRSNNGIVGEGSGGGAVDHHNSPAQSWHSLCDFTGVRINDDGTGQQINDGGTVDHNSSRSNNGIAGEGGSGAVDHNSTRSNNGIVGEGGSGAVDHNSTRSNNGIVGEGVDNVDDSTESRSGDTNKLSIGAGTKAIPNLHWGKAYDIILQLSIGAGTKAILNGSVRGDLVNNGMLVVNGDQLDSFSDVLPGEIGIADEPRGSNPTPHPLPVPELLDACFKDQLEHGPGMHDTLRDGFDLGPVNTAPSAEVKVDIGPIRPLEHGAGLDDTRDSSPYDFSAVVDYLDYLVSGVRQQVGRVNTP